MSIWTRAFLVWLAASGSAMAQTPPAQPNTETSPPGVAPQVVPPAAPGVARPVIPPPANLDPGIVTPPPADAAPTMPVIKPPPTSR